MLNTVFAVLLVIGSMTYACSAQARSHHRHYSHHASHHLRPSHHRRADRNSHVYRSRFRHARRHHASRGRLRFAHRLQPLSVMPVENSARNSPLVRVALRHLGSRNFTGRRGPWCGFAMNAFAREAGLPSVGSGRAIDWRNYGRPSRPHTGAIAVFRHHVGVVTGVIGNKIQLISGNHGGRVGIGLYSMSQVVAFRS